MYSVWFVFTSNLPTATVQAPHPPSAHPNFVPVLPLCLRYCKSVILVSTDDDGIVSLFPFTKNNKFDASISDDDDVSESADDGDDAFVAVSQQGVNHNFVSLVHEHARHLGHLMR